MTKRTQFLFMSGFARRPNSRSLVGSIIAVSVRLASLPTAHPKAGPSFPWLATV
jgi:hypothetical protein